MVEREGASGDERHGSPSADRSSADWPNADLGLDQLRPACSRHQCDHGAAGADPICRPGEHPDAQYHLAPLQLSVGSLGGEFVDRNRRMFIADSG